MKTIKIIAATIAVLLMTTFSLSAEVQKGDKKVETVTFAVSLHCQNCKAKVEKTIPWEKGVKDLTVNLDKKEVTLKYDPKKTDAQTLRKAIEKLGYTCAPVEEGDAQ